MMAENNQFAPVIRYGRLGDLNVYSVSEYELEILEQGSPGSSILSFGLAFISTAISFTITLLTTNIPKVSLFNWFLVITSIGYTAGIILLSFWWTNRKRTSKCIEDIKKRLVPEAEPIQQAIEDEGEEIAAT